MLCSGQHVGRYALSDRLGAGGMAEVWSATHRILGARVAIKVLHRPGPAQQRRLLREGRAQAALEHPNILPVRDVVEVGEGLGLVMPLVCGPTLEGLLAARRLSEAEAIAVMRAIVAGVAHAHEGGLVHRDLKPANVLLEVSRGRLVPRVSDFGLVQDPTDPHRTQAGAVMGTLCYAAPEQLLDAASVDHRADLFSLGVVLVELLSGQRPFEAPSLRALLSAYEASPQLDGVPPRWHPLCRSLLATSPDARLADCASLQSALDALQPPAPALLGLDGSLVRTARALWADTPHSGAAETLLSDADSLELEAASHSATPAHNLPSALDGFVGREADLDALAARLERDRLVSVLGPGGVGKTRLVLELAHQQLGDFPGGVWFCDLSEARDPSQLAAVVAQAMGLVLRRGAPQEQVGRAIAGRGRCLLVLDNFEQLEAGAADVVARWVAQASAVRVVVTSRRRLGVPGEGSLSLEPLDEAEACALFEARAQARRPGASDAGAVAELVRLLDGLPLAIELAAARISVMSPEKMVSRMGQRFRLLRTRQATLRGTIDWSWELMSDWERAAFAQCSVFEGSFTLEAAEAVLDLSGFEDDTGAEPWPMDAIQALVEHSMISVRGGDAAARFRMLLSLQAYAAGKLAANQGTARVKDRHAQWFALLGEDDALAALNHRGGGARWWELARDRANLAAAAAHAATQGDSQAAGRAALALAAVDRRQGPYTEAVGALRGAERLLGDDEAGLRAAVRAELGSLLQELGDPSAMATLDAALEDARGLSEPRREARVRLALHSLCAQRGLLEDSGDHLQRALDIAEQLKDRSLLGRCLACRCSLSSIRGDADAVEASGEQALRILRGVGDRRTEGGVLRSLANLCARQGRLEEARQMHRRALSIHRETGNRLSEASVLCSLGPIYTLEGRPREATEVLQRARRIALSLGSRDVEARALGFMGSLHRRQGDTDEAEACLKAALAIHREANNRRSLALWLGNLGNLYLTAGRPAEAEPCYREAAELAAAVGNPTVECNTLCNLGELMTRQGRFDEAAAVFQRALALAHQTRSRIIEPLVLGNLGGLYARQGHEDRAREHFCEALDQQRQIGNRSAEATLLCSLGDLDTHQEQLGAAEERILAALRIAREISEPNLEANVLGSLGGLRAAQGRFEEGRAVLVESEALFRSLDDRTLLVTMLLQRGSLEQRAGDEAAAEEYRQQAQQLAAELGLAPHAVATQLAHLLR